MEGMEMAGRCDFVLFLDIDGVLNNMRMMYATGQKNSSFVFDPVLIGYLNRYAMKGMQVVISSSWRGDRKSSGTLRQFIALAGGHQLASAFHKDWRTPDLGHTKTRGHEIEHWLAEHPEYLQFPKDPDYSAGPYRCIILDDEDHVLDWQLPEFVQTSHDDGMRYHNYLRFNQIVSRFDQNKNQNE